MGGVARSPEFLFQCGFQPLAHNGLIVQDKYFHRHLRLLFRGLHIRHRAGSTAFDPDKMQTTQVEFLSANYFKLVGEKPDLADAFALGDQVIALVDGVAYEVLPSDEPAQLVIAAPTDTPFTTPVVNETPLAPDQPTLVPTESPANQSSGLCGAGFIPLIFIPLIMVRVHKRKRSPEL